MRKQDFDKLIGSVKQAGKIRRGEMNASRIFKFAPADIKAIRGRLGKSQSEFALLIGVSVSTLRNWEQGRRIPEGPARACCRWPPKILKLLQRHWDRDSLNRDSHEPLDPALPFPSPSLPPSPCTELVVYPTLRRYTANPQ